MKNLFSANSCYKQYYLHNTKAGNVIPYRTNTVNREWSRGIQRRRNAQKGIFFNEHYRWNDYTA